MRCTAWILLGAAVAVGCGGRYPEPASPAAGSGEDAPEIAVEDAAMPYRVVGGDGREVAEDRFFSELGAARAVCIGESHSNPHHHWAQLTILDRLTRGDAAAMALGMEMFQRPFQGILDDYAAGRIDEATLLSRSDWEHRWSYDFALYRPMIELAVDRGLALLALNTERELTKKVSRKGLAALSPSDRDKLPELDLEDADHRAWFDGIMEGLGGAGGHSTKDESGGGADHGHGHGHGHDDMAERIYAAQVLWDETMAESAARWLDAAPGRRVVILAGNGHCHTSAIVNRLRRRGVEEVVSIQPIIDDGEGNVAAELAEPINDYLFIMSAPD